MTNETTASQPKSIGDDAQFQNWLVNYTMAVRAGEDGVKSCDELVAYIHAYFRAPAAQASATIQVAPRVPTEAMQHAARDWSVKKYGIGIGKDAAIGCWQAMWDAAAIQEPVMVAEPVGDKFSRVGFSVATGSARIIVATAITQEWADRIVSALAAPMVADPAGVARQALIDLRALHIGTLSTPTHFNAYLDIIDKALAATVKAVPSEALEVVASGYEGGTMISDPTGLGATISMHYASTAEAENAFDSLTRFIDGINFAAPLADKTGGGE